MSRDGSTIAGSVNSYISEDGYYGRAYRWHVGNDGVNGTMTDLGSLGGRYTWVSAVNSDGEVSW